MPLQQFSILYSILLITVTISLSQKGPHEMYDTELLAHVYCIHYISAAWSSQPEKLIAYVSICSATICHNMPQPDATEKGVASAITYPSCSPDFGLVVVSQRSRVV